MTAAVETMAWAHEVPWHGLGVQVDPRIGVDGMLEAAGLAWTVSKRALYTQGTGRSGGRRIAVPGHMALVRDTDDSVLSVVGSRWHPLQNRDALAFFDSFVQAGGATMETAGSLMGGRLVWGLARLGADFDAGRGDPVRGYLLLVSPHESGRAIVAKTTHIRVVCANTLALALRDANTEVRIWHSREFDPVAATEALGIAREQVVEFAKNARTLRRLKLSREEVIRLLQPVYARRSPALADATDAELKDARTLGPYPVIKKIMEAYDGAPGAEPGTGWGALAAVTYYSDHIARRSRDHRLRSSWLGTESTRKSAVLERLLEAA